MFNIKRAFIGGAAFVALLASCKKEDSQYVIQTGSFGANSLRVSSANVTLTRAAQNDTAITLTWNAASFGEKPVITYTLQVDKTADTSGTSAWGGAKNFTLGTNIYRYAFVAKDLNGLLGSLGLPAGSASNVAMRVKADVPQYNGAGSSVAAAYTSTAVASITTYSQTLYIPGALPGLVAGHCSHLKPGGKCNRQI